MPKFTCYIKDAVDTVLLRVTNIKITVNEVIVIFPESHEKTTTESSLNSIKINRLQITRSLN